MSIYASTDTGSQWQIASNQGWSDVGSWITSLDESEFQLLHELWNDGASAEPKKIAAEIKRATRVSPPMDTVKKTLDILVDFLESEEDDEAAIIINNGIEADDAST